MPRGHRLVAAVLDFESRHARTRERQERRFVVSGVRGRVLEIGVGVGANWAYLPASTSYVGIDPDPFMIARANRNAAARGLDLELHEVAAESLPFEDGSFDTVFTTLTFCTVADVPRALAEVKRVLAPGGEFRFWEHVRPEGRISGAFADAIVPVWRVVGAGCNPNRRTIEAIRAAGFTLIDCIAGRLGPMPTVRGVARAGR
jgi:ubiquinone/menaquinone biosynthesis C-methylase UbiE